MYIQVCMYIHTYIHIYIYIKVYTHAYIQARYPRRAVRRESWCTTQYMFTPCTYTYMYKIVYVCIYTRMHV